MGYAEILVIAVALSMDAFAISITIGLSYKELTYKRMLIPGIYFGLFQAIMPLIGYFAGVFFIYRIQELDHWAAFLLLGFVGGKMIKDCFSRHEEKLNKFGFMSMIILAIATSIDALAVGITFSFFRINIFSAIAIIGLTTFGFSIGGVKIGNVFGMKFKSKAEFIGGLILIILGIKILIEHLTVNN